MTFEEALKRLAEREPKTFYWGEGHRFKWHFGIVDVATGLRVHTITQYHDGGVSEVTQDDIDEILAKIGWEYEVNHTHDQRAWTAWIWRVEDYITLNGRYTRPSPSKLEAAKSALLAVVEKEYPL